MSKNKNPVKVAVVGCGYWGPNIVRNFIEIKEANLVACCDLRKERLSLVESRYPTIKTTTDYSNILQDKEVEAVAIVTPLNSHYILAKQALQAGKHVWLEKPMTQTSVQSEKLIKLAKEKKNILHVDHVFLYTEAVNSIKRMIDRKKLGRIYYFDSVRINLGLFQPDSNVVWDLAPHDISIMNYLLGKAPKTVSVFGTPHISQKYEDTAYLSFKFSKKISAHIHISWLSPVKIRRTMIVGSRKMIMYNALEASEKVKIYDYGVKENRSYKPETSTSGYQYRTGDIYAPALETNEALRSECKHFIDCIRRGKKSRTSGDEGLAVVRILEAADLSLKQNGKPIKIKQ